MFPQIDPLTCVLREIGTKWKIIIFQHDNFYKINAAYTKKNTFLAALLNRKEDKMLSRTELEKIST